MNEEMKASSAEPDVNDCTYEGLMRRLAWLQKKADAMDPPEGLSFSRTDGHHNRHPPASLLEILLKIRRYAASVLGVRAHEVIYEEGQVRLGDETAIPRLIEALEKMGDPDAFRLVRALHRETGHCGEAAARCAEKLKPIKPRVPVDRRHHVPKAVPEQSPQRVAKVRDFSLGNM